MGAMPTPNQRAEPAPPGQRLLVWFALAARATREAADAPPEEVAGVLRMNAETIKRFEKALHWPKEPDQFAAAYAHVAGLDDGRAIYQLALDLWHEHGTKPLLGRRDEPEDGLGPAQRVERIIREQVARDRAGARGGPAAASTPTAKRRAAGR